MAEATGPASPGSWHGWAIVAAALAQAEGAVAAAEADLARANAEYRRLAAGARPEEIAMYEAMLAQAILDLSNQIVLLRAKLADPDPALFAVQVLELSGGGGRLSTRLPLKVEDRLEIRFEPDHRQEQDHEGDGHRQAEDPHAQDEAQEVSLGGGVGQVAHV